MLAEMDLTSVETDITAHSLPKACAFLGILNLDIRIMIYRYLLVGSYNRRELDMSSQEVYEQRN